MLALQLLKRDLELVQAIVARLVDAWRLAGRPDEHAGKQVRERRMVLPVRNQALQQVGAPQQRTFGRCGAAQRNVVAAAGTGVAAVEHEFLGAEAGSPRGSWSTSSGNTSGNEPSGNLSPSGESPGSA